MLAGGLWVSVQEYASAAATVATYATGNTESTWTVPAGVTSVYVEVVGASGGDGGKDGNAGGLRGPVGYVHGPLAVSGGSALQIAVGGGGTNGTYTNAGGYGSYGASKWGYHGGYGGAVGPKGQSGGGGGGGAGTAVRVPGVTGDVVAGGGAGGGGAASLTASQESTLGAAAKRAGKAAACRAAAVKNGENGVSVGSGLDGGGGGGGGGGVCGGAGGPLFSGKDKDNLTQYSGYGGYAGSSSTADIETLSTGSLTRTAANAGTVKVAYAAPVAVSWPAATSRTAGQRLGLSQSPISPEGGTIGCTWMLGSRTATGCTTPAWELTPADSGTLTLQVTNTVTHTRLDDVTVPLETTTTTTTEVTVHEAPQITSTPTTDAMSGASYATALTGTAAGPVQWSVSGPSWLALDTSGPVTLQGTPPTAGSHEITVTLTDANGATATQTFTIVVAPGVRTLLIDSLAAPGVGTETFASTQDANPGDGSCADASGRCTLLAAVQEANATPGTDPVVIRPAADVDSATAGVQSTGTVPVANAATSAVMMSTTKPSPVDSGSYYVLARANVRLDLEGRLGVAASGTGATGAVFSIEATDVTIAGFTAIKAASSSIVVTDAGDRATIADGVTTDYGSTMMKRFLVVMAGADDLTMRNVEVASWYGSSSTAYGGAIIYQNSASKPITRLTVDRCRFPATAGDNQGTEAYTFGPLVSSPLPVPLVDMKDLTIKDSVFQGTIGTAEITFSRVRLDGAQIYGNTVGGGSSTSVVPIIFGPDSRLAEFTGATTYVRDNVFLATGNKGVFLRVQPANTSANLVTPLVIEDNYFDGFTRPIYLQGAGIVTVQRNTLGPGNTMVTTAAAETGTSGGLHNLASNGTLATWYPTAVTKSVGGCAVDLTVTPPASGTLPTYPASLDVYWTAGTTAERYLGRFEVTSATATTLAVPYTGGNGNFRVQTLDASGRSSQYSRTVALTATDTCGPTVTVEQATGQPDPTSVRDLAYRVTVSEPLATSGAGALTAGDFVVTGAPNARVVSVTKLTDTTYQVVARADGSGTVRVSLPAGAVTDAGGQPSVASTSVDNAVTYVSPLSLSPSVLTVAEGGPAASYTVTASTAPTAPVTVTRSGSAAAWTATPASLVIPVGGTGATAGVSAVDDALVNGTRTGVVGHVASSADPSFDGLVLPELWVTVTDNDPSAEAVLAHSTIAASASTLTADTTSTATVTVTLRGDVTGTALGTGAGSVVIRSSVGTVGPVIDNGDGTYTATLTAPGEPGTATLSFSIDGVAAAATATVDVLAAAADPAASTVEVGQARLVAGSGASTTVTVVLRDAEGNPVGASGAGQAVVIASRDSDDKPVGTVSAVVDHGDGTYSATLTAATSVADAVVSFTVDGEPGGSTVPVSFVPGQPSASMSTVTVDTAELTADGMSTATVTVTLRDAYGNPVTGDEPEVTVRVNGAELAATRKSDGTYTATLTAGTTAGIATVSFTVDDVPGVQHAQVAMIAAAADPASSMISVSPGTVVGNGISSAAVTVVLVDAHGNRLTRSGGTVTMTTTAGTLGPVVDNGDGSYTATLTAPVGRAQATVGFAVDGAAATATATVAFVPGPVDLTRSTIQAGQASLVAGSQATTTVTVTLRDAQGTPVGAAGRQVQVTTTRGTVTAVTDNGDGTYSVELTAATTVSDAVLGFTVDAQPGLRTALVSFVAGEPSTSQSTIEIGDPTLTADGTSTTTVTVALKDAYGNPVTGGAAVVALATDRGTVSAVTDNGDGTYTATLTAPTAVGTGAATVSFTVDSRLAASTAQVGLVPGAVSAATSTISASPSSVPANGASTAAVTVVLRDASGNRLTSGAGTVTLATTVGTISAASDNGDGTYTAVLTVPDDSNDPGEAVVSFSVGGGWSGNTATVRFTDATPPDAPVVTAAGGSMISGTAEAGSVVTVTGPGGTVCTATAHAETGTFSCTFGSALGDGVVLSLTATDAAGNTSTATPAVTDASAPAVPQVNASNGEDFSGMAEPGSTVTVTGPDGTATCEADDSGAFECPMSPPLGDGAIVTVTATDEAGNVSLPATVVVDAASMTPTINPTNGRLITGIAEPGATVVVTGSAGTLCTVTANAATGAFVCVAETAAAHESTITVVATDVLGNVSEPATATVDAEAFVVSVDPTNGTRFSGVAEPGATVKVYAADELVCEDSADQNTGAFGCDSTIGRVTGTATITVTDTLDNTDQTTVTIDSEAPKLTVTTATPTRVAGVTEPYAPLTIAVPGRADVTVVADAAGSYAYVLTDDQAIADGTTVTVTATDAAGNTTSATKTVDGIPPAAPVVTIRTTASVSGTVEPGAAVTITVGGVTYSGTEDGLSLDPVTGEFSWTPPEGVTLSDGQQVVLTATDTAGNVSAPATVVIDGTAPAAPVVALSNGDLVKGSAEPGATVVITTDPASEPVTVLCTLIVPPSGNFSCTLDPGQPNGAVLEVTATDKAGNTSVPTPLTVSRTKPLTPVPDPTNGSTVQGTADAGTTVTVTGPGGVALCSTTATGDGHFSCTPNPQPGDGVKLSVVSTSPSGVDSDAASVTVDAVAPAKPTVDLSNGSVVSGKVEPGATVTITIDGVPNTVTADAITGEFSWTPEPALAHGTVVQVTATDAVGNVSVPTTVTVDNLAPAAPTVQPSRGDAVLVTGVEAGAMPVIRDTASQAEVAGTWVQGTPGTWTFTPTEPLSEDDSLVVLVVDPTGNTSLPTPVVVDATKPLAPEVDPSNGSVVSGTAEPGATVTITVGETRHTETADATTGEFSWTPEDPLDHDAAVSVTATDAAGNVSEATSVVVDAVADAPVMSAWTATQIAGTAEPGSTVTISVGGVDHTVTADATTGAFSWDPATAEVTLKDGDKVLVSVTDRVGNVSEPIEVTIDATAPDAAEVTTRTGETVAGTAEPGSTVVVTGPAGTEPVTCVVAKDGSFSCDVSGWELKDEDEVTVTVTDPAGNQTTAEPVAVDTVPPVAPVVPPTNGSDGLSGSVDPGSTVVVTGPAGTEPVTCVVDEDGGFTCDVSGWELEDGDEVTVTVTDPAGNTAETTVTVDAHTDAPVVPPTNGSGGLSGSVEPGSTVVVTGPDGQVCTPTVGEDGSFSCDVSGWELEDGDEVTVTVTDPAGNTAETVVTVDAHTDAPDVHPTNGTGGLSGSVEPGSTVVVTGPDGQVCTPTVGEDGSFSCDVSGWELEDGDEITVTVTDPAGNTAASTVTVDRAAPPEPSMDAHPGKTVSGSAEPGATVTVTDPSTDPATVLCTAVVGKDGTFSCELDPAPAGETVMVTVTDPAGNESAAVTVTVDTAAPEPPVAATNGEVISGTGEPGATVTVTDPSTDPATVLCTAVIGEGGTFSCELDETPAGSTVVVTVTDPAGNVSDPVTVTVDTTAPADPTVAPSGGGSVVVTGVEAGAHPVIRDAESTDEVPGSWLEDPEVEGRWVFTPETALTEDAEVEIVVTDPAGNKSAAVAVVIDTTVPADPTVSLSGGASVVVTGVEDGAHPVIRDADTGVPVAGTWREDPDTAGRWVFTPTTPLSEDDEVEVVVVDGAGNQSDAAAVTVDTTDPVAPTVAPSAGTSVVVTGVEAGAHPVIRDAESKDEVAGSWAKDPEVEGRWVFTPTTPLTEDDGVEVVVTDSAGNQSDPVTVVVDTTDPVAPTVAPSGGTSVVVTGVEDGARPMIRDAATGAVVPGVWVEDPEVEGRWVFTPASPLAEGVEVEVVVTDAAGNVSAPVEVELDLTAPDAAEAATNGAVMSGTGEPGATVTVTDPSTDPATVLCTMVVGEDGTFSCELAPAPVGGTVVVTVTDPAGNVSDPVTVTVDTTAPDVPVVDAHPGKTVSGSAEAGSTVTVTDPSTAPATVLCTAIAGQDGRFACTLNPAPSSNITVSVTATDVAGNTSSAASVTVDVIAPAAPVVDPSNGSVVSGTAEPGSSVAITVGSTTYTVAADATTGAFTWTLSPALTDGTSVSVTATDAAGNTSPATSITIDATAPAAPVVTTHTAGLVAGIAEAGSTVTIRVGDDTYTVDADATTGAFIWEPSPALADGTSVSVSATDAAGNISPAKTVSVDATAPDAPVVTSHTAGVIAGMAEKGSSVTIRVAGVDYPVTADATTGEFSWTPSSALAEGTSVSVTATDKAGNVSNPTVVTVDATPPVDPTVAPSGGASVVVTGVEDGARPVVRNVVSGTPVAGTWLEDPDIAGRWVFTPTSPLTEDAAVQVVVMDEAGNESAPVAVSVDTTAPDAPVVTSHTAGVIAGMAEKGSSVTIRVAGVDYPVTADATTGEFSWTPSSALAEGTSVSVTATDAAGNTSPATTVKVDATAPDAAVVTIRTGETVAGTAEPGSTVMVTGPAGTEPVTCVVGSDGSFACDVSGWELADDDEVTVTVTDAAGNQTAGGPVTIDATRPAAPVVDPSNGSVVAGTAEAGSTVTVTDADGKVLCTATANATTGAFSCVPSPKPADGATVSVTATDQAGNTSPAKTVTVDAVAPGKPSVKPSDGFRIDGTAEPGSTVVVTDPRGVEVCAMTADKDGKFYCYPWLGLDHGDVVTVTVSDPAGNATSSTVTIDAEAEPATTAPSDGSRIAGTAEPGSTVTVTGPPGTEPVECMAGKDGSFSCDVSGWDLEDGDEVTVRVTDPAGNVSEPVTVTIDAKAPGAPSVSVRTAGKVAGTAEPGSIVTVTGPNGVLCTTTADGQGKYSCVPLPTPTDGVEVSVTATDPAGNTSPATTAVIDAQAPKVPVAGPSDGSRVTGSVDPGSTVTVTGPAGTEPIVCEVEQDGTFSCDVSSWDLGDGDEVTVTVSDPAGNTTTSTVKVDTKAPTKPTLNSTDGKKVSGRGEPGAIVTVSDAAGTVLCTAKVAGNGTFSCVPLPQPGNGDKLTVMLTDALGHESKPATVTVKITATTTTKKSSGGASSSAAGGTATTTAPDQVTDPVVPDPAEQSPSPQPTPQETAEASPSPSPTVVAPGEDTDPAQQGVGWQGWGWIIGFLLLAATGGAGWWLFARRRNHDSCAVCGATVDQDDTPFTFTVDDRSFYFCSDQCRDSFIATFDRQGRG